MSLEIKAIGKIPAGMYCYTGKSVDPDGTYHIDLCPFWTWDHYFNMPYCTYLKEFGVPNGVSDEHWGDLLEHFNNNHEELFKFAPLDLLWDQCKECGINNEYEEEIDIDTKM